MYTAESSAISWRFIFAAYAGATKTYVGRNRESDAVFQSFLQKLGEFGNIMGKRRKEVLGKDESGI